MMQLLMFADDTVLLAETEGDLQHSVREFGEAVKWHRLAMDTEEQQQWSLVGSRWIVVRRWMAGNWRT